MSLQTGVRLLILFNEFFRALESEVQGSSKATSTQQVPTETQLEWKAERGRTFDQQIEWDQQIDRTLPLNEYNMENGGRSRPSSEYETETEDGRESKLADRFEKQIEWEQQIGRSLPLKELYDPSAESEESGVADAQKTLPEPSQSVHSTAFSMESTSKTDSHSLAEKYFYEGKYEESVSRFDEIIESKSSIAKHYRNRGLARTRLKDPDLLGAIEDFEKSLEIEPLSVRGRFHLGRTNFMLGKYDVAIENLNLARQLAEEQRLITDERNQVLTVLEKACKKMVEVQSGNLKAWSLLGLASRELGKHDEAIKTLEKGLQIAENLTKEIHTLLKETQEEKGIEVARKSSEEEEYDRELAMIVAEDRREYDSKEDVDAEQNEEEIILKMQHDDSEKNKTDAETNEMTQPKKPKDDIMTSAQLEPRKEVDEEGDAGGPTGKNMETPMKNYDGDMLEKSQEDAEKKEEQKEINEPMRETIMATHLQKEGEETKLQIEP